MAKSIDDILKSYPRQSPPISAEMEAMWEEIYLASRTGQSILSRITHWLESWMHHRVAAGSAAGQQILEIGAGPLNHLPFEPVDATYDVVEPCPEWYRESSEIGRVSTFYTDIEEIDPDKRYDRIISIATLEHIHDLPHNLARAGLLLKRNGVFSAGIPSEGGFLWGASWRLSTGLVFRLKTGFDYGDLVRHEHVSDAPDIVGLLQAIFRHVEVRRFPLSFHHLSLYTLLRCREVDEEFCRNLLGETEPVAAKAVGIPGERE